MTINTDSTVLTTTAPLIIVNREVAMSARMYDIEQFAYGSSFKSNRFGRDKNLEQKHADIFHASSKKFGVSHEHLQGSHFSEHSLIGSYKRGGIKVFLRITSSSHKQYEKILGEVQWVDYLVNSGLCVSRPFRSVDGNLPERIIVDDNGANA